ncbi:hypothetical protein ENUP19_0303G0003 [Entamoeba nuttalli]|uniref:Uncharacterized protein n=1 Tax=Entamoeba nuttalli TaxID=412467 RepID=A0ABQ0DV30_9EUKA
MSYGNEKNIYCVAYVAGMAQACIDGADFINMINGRVREVITEKMDEMKSNNIERVELVSILYWYNKFCVDI